MSVDPSWKEMYKIGGISAILTGILSVILLPLVFAVSAAFPPSSGSEAIKAIAGNKLFFLAAEGVTAPSWILLLPLALALYLALKGVNRNYTLIASGLIGVSMLLFLVDTAVGFSLAGLSDGYATAAGTQQTAYVAAADLAQGTISGLSSLGHILLGVGILINSLVMLKGVFSKWIAYIGILTGILSLEPFPIPALGILGALVIAAFGILGIIWSLAVGYRLYKLG